MKGNLMSSPPPEFDGLHLYREMFIHLYEDARQLLTEEEFEVLTAAIQTHLALNGPDPDATQELPQVHGDERETVEAKAVTMDEGED